MSRKKNATVTMRRVCVCVCVRIYTLASQVSQPPFPYSPIPNQGSFVFSKPPSYCAWPLFLCLLFHPQICTWTASTQKTQQV